MKSGKSAIAIAAVLVAAVLADILIGGDAPAEVFRLLRIPRAVTAAASGAALALAGAQMQAVFRNPLADPHIMGVSSGAGLGAAAVTLAGGAGAAAGLTIAVSAAAGALLTSLLVIYVSGKTGSADTLLIFGVMTGFAFSAITAILQALAAPDSLKLFYSWSAGSFSHCGDTGTGIIIAAAAAGGVIAFRGAKGLDLLLFGDSFATLSGASPKKIRWTALASCCIVTGAVTAFCGPIGFVGIIAPHIARRLTGSAAHMDILPVSLVAGAVLALAADTIAQIPPSPLPAGSTMAIIGIPAILYIMVRTRNGGRSAQRFRMNGPDTDGQPVRPPRAEETAAEGYGLAAGRRRTLFSIRDLSIGYGDNVLCSDISFDIKEGDCILLCGANGSGKTTLLRTIAATGNRRSGNIIMIPSGIPRVKGFTLEEFIRTGFFTQSDWKGRLSAEEEARIRQSLEEMGLQDLKDRDISALSDGEFQKGCIASAICRKAEVILLDEPAAFLDTENRLEILAGIDRVCKERGTAVIFSSHDIREAAARCSRIAAIGADGCFRISDTGCCVEEKIRIAGSIFRNKNTIFDVLTS